jgi:hypothetical protein
MKSIKRFFRFCSCIGAAIAFIGILAPSAHAANILNIGGTCYTEDLVAHPLGDSDDFPVYEEVACPATLDVIPAPPLSYVIEYAGTSANGTILYTIMPA